MAWVERGKLGAIPVGGDTGQVLTKASAEDKDVVWSTPSGGGPETTDDLPEGSNLYFTDDRARDAVLTQAIAEGDTEHAPSGDSVFAELSNKANADAVWNAGTAGAPPPTAGSSSDLNSSVGTHVFYANGSENRPSTGNGFVWGLTAEIGGLGYGVQEWGRVSRRFFRSLEMGSWGDWQEYWHTGNFNPSSKADDSAVVHNTGNESVAGEKTFSSIVAVQGPITNGIGVWVNRSGSSNNSSIRYTTDGGSIYAGQRQSNTWAVGPGPALSASQWVNIREDSVYPGSNGSSNLGLAIARWNVVYAVTGSINTSDAREKTEPRDLTEAELAAAADIARLPCIFQWHHAIEEKGEGARLHASPTVQSVIAAMESHGLDPFRYGFVCYDEWDETPEVKDEETGEVTQEYRPAGDRYSLRPTELAHFVMRGLAHRQDELERRLAALEG